MDQYLRVEYANGSPRHRAAQLVPRPADTLDSLKILTSRKTVGNRTLNIENIVWQADFDEQGFSVRRDEVTHETPAHDVAFPRAIKATHKQIKAIVENYCSVYEQEVRNSEKSPK